MVENISDCLFLIRVIRKLGKPSGSFFEAASFRYLPNFVSLYELCSDCARNAYSLDKEVMEKNCARGCIINELWQAGGDGEKIFPRNN